MPSFPRLRPLLASLIAAAVLTALPGAAAANPSPPAYAPGEVVVGYAPSAGGAAAQAAVAASVGARVGGAPAPRTRVLHVAPGRVRATVAELRRTPGVAFAAPNPIAHASELALPDDPGLRGFPGGLAALQWNFFGSFGVNALQAWSNVAGRAPGGRGVRIAVLDTGVAYRNLGRFRRSPDFAGTKFVAPWDFVDGTRFPVDRNGHGTHVAGTIAEATDNALGVAGLAWGATIMPVRVLDARGYGDATTIAKGIRYAVRHNARVINMSLEFSTSVRQSEIPDITAALRYANRHGVVVVGSSGNEGEARIAYPARTSNVISVGATTDDGCLANFSNDGFGLDLVAPGGGVDADLTNDPNCRPGHRGGDIYQMTYTDSVTRFGLPSGYDGTSMAAPHVSASAALVIASRLLGARPTPGQVECRLKATAKALGIPAPNRVYGYGLVDAGAATSAAVQTPQCLSASARSRR
ncbi:MAG: S8 family serine peptidase [Actinobacteria bacterium]|nr:S8 family serine peptidase [Actinomycetota bacterium]